MKERQLPLQPNFIDSRKQKRQTLYSLLASQRLQECAKICVKKCKRTKNWKIDFADVCIFFFWRQSYLQIFAYLRPSTVPRSHFSYPKTKAFTLIISYLYLQVVTSVSESRFCVGKWFIAKKSMLSAKIWYSFWGLITPTFGYQCNPEENFVHFEASSSYVIFKNFIENCWCLSILTWVRRNISAWKFGD